MDATVNNLCSTEFPLYGNVVNCNKEVYQGLRQPLRPFLLINNTARQSEIYGYDM